MAAIGCISEARYLARPARHLAGQEAARPAKSLQPGGAPVDAVQRRDDVVHRGEHRLPLLRVHARQALVVENPAGHIIHHVEGAADDGGVVAIAVHPGHRHRAIRQRSLHTVFTIHRMRARQQRAERTAAQDIISGLRNQPAGGIGLAALERQHAQRTAITGNVALHPRLQRRQMGIERLWAASRHVSPAIACPRSAAHRPP